MHNVVQYDPVRKRWIKHSNPRQYLVEHIAKGDRGDGVPNLLSKDELKASESFQAKIKVDGKGNLNLFKLPEINVPNTLEVYEPERSEKIKTTLTGTQGSIRWSK